MISWDVNVPTLLTIVGVLISAYVKLRVLEERVSWIDRDLQEIHDKLKRGNGYK